MAYGNGFPATYQQQYTGYQQQPYNAFQQQYGYQQQVQQQTMTPPTIHAEIIQFGSEEEIDRFPMQAGASQMFMSKDEQHIVIKTMYANGQYNKDYYDKRPPAPEVETAQFVTREEAIKLIEEALNARKPAESEAA